MKKLLYVLVALITFSACKKEKEVEPKEKKESTQVGTWRLESIITYADSGRGPVDSSMNSNRSIDHYIQFEENGSFNFVSFLNGEDQVGYFGDTYSYKDGVVKINKGYAFEISGGLEGELQFPDDNTLVISFLYGDSKLVLTYYRSQIDISHLREKYLLAS